MIKQILNKIQTELHAPKGQFNKFGNYKYRSCEDILEALKPLLKETGAILTVSDEVVQVGDRYYIKATATLSNEESHIFATAFAREPESRKGMDDAQVSGATSSYARKYSLNGLFCIDDTRDTDTMDRPEEKINKAVETASKIAQVNPMAFDVLKTSNPSIQTPEEIEEIRQETIGLIKREFGSKEKFDVWCMKKGIKKPVNDMTQSELKTLLDLAKGI
jgi:hypothetical protein